MGTQLSSSEKYCICVCKKCARPTAECVLCGSDMFTHFRYDSNFPWLMLPLILYLLSCISPFEELITSRQIWTTWLNSMYLPFVISFMTRFIGFIMIACIIYRESFAWVAKLKFKLSI